MREQNGLPFPSLQDPNRRTLASAGHLGETGTVLKYQAGSPSDEAVSAGSEHRMLLTVLHAVQNLQLTAGAKRDDNAVSGQVQLLELGRREVPLHAETVF